MTASHFDIWLTKANRVYKAVPYEVVSDWLQQGRVASADRVRPAGHEEWRAVEDYPTLAVYLPVASSSDANDEAEALQSVDLGITIRGGRHETDEDVDMVPLIDISLVLLIFFMMTSTVASGGSNVVVPETQYASLTSDRSMLWVGIDLGPDSQPVYSFGEGERAAAEVDQQLSIDGVIERVRQKLRTREGGRPMSVRVAAHHRLQYEIVQQFTARLSALRSEGLSEIKAEVSERAK
jgi:biopolymer transport protein ExbD